MDLVKAISAAVKTGKVSFGGISAIQNAQSGKAKLIILAANCPESICEEVKYHSTLSKVPSITFTGNSMDLATVCGRPFSVSALSIREPGDSEILRATETLGLEKPDGVSE